MVKVTYSSNNSGGGWWLKDEDWLKLERAGWTVLWGGEVFCNSTYKLFAKGKNANRAPNTCPIEIRDGREFNTCQGHVAYDSYDAMEADNGRWLDSAAREAHKEFDSLKDAILEWEKVTCMDASAEGCNCCGAPHTFSSDTPSYEYVSGEDIVHLLYDTDGMSLRDMAKKLRGK